MYSSFYKIEKHDIITREQEKVDDDDSIDRLIVAGSVTLTVSMILFDRAFSDTFRHQGHPLFYNVAFFFFLFFITLSAD